MKYIFNIALIVSFITVTILFNNYMEKISLEFIFFKIKKLFNYYDIAFPEISEIYVSSYYEINNFSNLTINKKIEGLKKKTMNYNNIISEYNKQLKFFSQFKIMKLIYDNFFYNNKIKPNTKILFEDSKWYEMTSNIKYLGIINNQEFNFENLENSVEELTIVNPIKIINNLPPTLKKLYLYNIESFDIKKIKIPFACDLYIESCLIDKNKLI
jgi:hypothetical protein